MRQYSGKTIAVGTAIGIIAVWYIAYSFAIQNTIDVQRQNKELHHTIERIQGASQKIEDVQHTIARLQETHGSRYILQTDFQSALIKMIADFCEKNSMNITSIPTSHDFVKNEFLIQTYQLTVTGNFVQHVQLLAELESRLPGARITSGTFEKKTDIRRKTTLLYMTVLMQKIQEQKT
jgi:hypothetical protein